MGDRKVPWQQWKPSWLLRLQPRLRTIKRSWPEWQVGPTTHCSQLSWVPGCNSVQTTRRIKKKRMRLSGASISSKALPTNLTRASKGRTRLVTPAAGAAKTTDCLFLTSTPSAEALQRVSPLLQGQALKHFDM